MIQKSKIGIFGGTFSPPHFGHIYAAEVFLKEANLDKLLIMPTFIPPHKQLQDDHPLLRMEMVQLAFQDCFEYGKRLLVDPYEISRQQKSYTYQTLIHFADPTKELYFLCGTDMFLTLPHWRRPDIICDLAVITLMRREENPEKEEEIERTKKFLQKQFHAKTLCLTAPAKEISSTQVRSAIRDGISVDTLLPNSVSDFIKRKGLYLS